MRQQRRPGSTPPRTDHTRPGSPSPTRYVVVGPGEGRWIPGLRPSCRSPLPLRLGRSLTRSSPGSNFSPAISRRRGCTSPRCNAGRRLPNEWEWQYAAQGIDERKYPWGNTFDPTRIPPSSSARDGLPPPSDVTAYPTGASPFGVLDMVGNVWQWTNEFTDHHTAAAVIRGGSYHRPQARPGTSPPTRTPTGSTVTTSTC